MGNDDEEVKRWVGISDYILYMQMRLAGEYRENEICHAVASQDK